MKKTASILILCMAGLVFPNQADAQNEVDKVRSNIINTVFPSLYSSDLKMKRNINFQLTSRSDFMWDAESETWVEFERYEFDHDASGRIEELFIVIQDSEERPRKRRTIERSENSETWTDEVYSEMNQQFEPDEVTTIEYSNELPGYPDEIVIQTWVNGVWENSERQTFQYSDGDLFQILDQTWVNGEWRFDFRNTFSEENGNVVIVEEQWGVDSQEWQNVFRESFLDVTITGLFESFIDSEFSGEDFPALYTIEAIPGGVFEEWQEEAWEYLFRRVVNIDFQNGSVPSSKELRFEEWDGNSWQMEIQFTYQYNSDGNPVELSGKVPTDGEGGLFEVVAEDYVYNNGELLTSITTRAFDGESFSLTERNEFTWEPQLVTSTESGEKPAEISLGIAYPNPFNPQTVVPYTLNETKHVEITLHDILGRKVDVLFSGTQSMGTHQIRVDGAGLSSGLYIVRMTDGDFIITRSITLVK